MPHVNQKYRAFISYSHRDAKWAKWLHRSLERYAVPLDVYPSSEKIDPELAKRRRSLSPVFRDRDELPASGSLADTIQEALESSENLIVLCSPNSAASQYVNAEIEIFRGLSPDNDQKVYALIVEGEPPDCFPAALTAGGAEPIAADAREVGDGKADAKLKLIAGMLGVGFDRLKQREAKRQRNRLIVMVSVVSAVAVMTSFLAVWALKAEKEATKQKEVAVEQRAKAEIAEKDAVKQKDLALKAEKEALIAEKEAVKQKNLAETAEKEAVKQKNFAEEQRVLAVEAEKEAVKQKDLAVKKKKEALAVYGFFDANVLAAVRPKHQKGGLGKDATIRAAIDAAEPKISRSFSDQPKVEATIRTTMGTSYWYLGDAKIAIPQLRRALALRVRELGIKDPETLKTMTILANSYHRVGRREEAMEMREKNLEFKKEVMGHKHIDTLTSASNLAVSYRGAGRFPEALALDEETLALRKEVLGPLDPDTISSMGSLASSYVSLGRNKEALVLREEVLRLFKKELGHGHPDSLNAMQNVANSYDIAGRGDEAQALHKETLKLRIEVQGSEHTDTMRAMYNMANAFINAGRWKEAVALHEQTLKLRIKSEVLGLEHPDTVGTMNSLAYSYWKSGRLADAEKQYRQMITILKKQAASDLAFFHAQSLYGEVLLDMKKYAEAEPVLLESYKGMEQTVTKNKAGRGRLQFAVERILTLYQKWGKPEKAAPWQEKLKALEASSADPEPLKK